MSQQEDKLIDIEKQDTTQEQNGKEMKHEQSFISLSSIKFKMTSLPNADNMPDKLRLHRKKLSVRNKEWQNGSLISNDEKFGRMDSSKLGSRIGGPRFETEKSIKSIEGLMSFNYIITFYWRS